MVSKDRAKTDMGGLEFFTQHHTVFIWSLVKHQLLWRECLAQRGGEVPHHSPFDECTWYVSHAHPRPAVTQRLPHPVCIWDWLLRLSSLSSVNEREKRRAYRSGKCGLLAEGWLETGQQACKRSLTCWQWRASLPPILCRKQKALAPTWAHSHLYFPPPHCLPAHHPSNTQSKWLR
jgi:hypothetical protein